MPEPKKQKRTYDAQAQSALRGMQILPQAGRKENGAASQLENARRGIAEQSALIEKLINFIKSMD